MFMTAFPISKRWQWRLLLLVMGLFAFGARYYYILHAQVQQPRGDAIEYLAYAHNLIQHGVFTMAPAGETPVLGDSFRDPGYPLFLAAWMKIFHQWDSWYAAVLLSQAVLSALTVVVMLCVGRRWMPMRWLALAGLLMAVWPHSVTMSGYLLSETLFGFLTALGLLLLCHAIVRRSIAWAVASGIGLSLAALTNAVMLPFAFLAALYLLARRQLSAVMFASLVIAALATTVPWAVRNAMLPSGESSSANRALLNLVQGSWPDMHAAYQAKAAGDPSASILLAPINQESALIRADPLTGVSHMAHRMATHPGAYIRWYLSKPMLLWDWSIRVGQGDVYVFPTRNSPFETSISYRIVAAMCQALNPWLFVLAIAGCVLALLPRSQTPPDTAVSALMLVFVTLVYSVLQAEPRYSVPFRGLEIVVAIFAAHRSSQWIAHLRKPAQIRATTTQQLPTLDDPIVESAPNPAPEPANDATGILPPSTPSH